MIIVFLSLAMAEMMWGERAQKSCFDYDGETGKLTQLKKSQCRGVGIYFVRYADGSVGSRPLKRAANAGALYPWKKCEDERGITIPFDKEGRFRPECMPDTLYSWQRCSRVRELEKYSTPEEVLPLSQSKGFLYGWRTPLATSSYNRGECTIRIKLKPGVKAIRTNSHLRRNCQYHPAAQRGEAVVVNHAGNAHEYIICNSKVVESWSTETSEHFKELQRDWDWSLSHDEKDFDWFTKADGTCWYKQDPVYITGILKRLKPIFQRPQSQVYLSKGAKASSHFDSKYKSYFNP